MLSSNLFQALVTLILCIPKLRKTHKDIKTVYTTINNSVTVMRYSSVPVCYAQQVEEGKFID